MPTTTTQPLDNTQAVIQPHAGAGLAIARLTIGVMLVWVFFENLGERPLQARELCRSYQLLYPE
jgi:hypothetical protein